MFDTTLFNVNIPNISSCEGAALVLSGCHVCFKENTPYSELDELNYVFLNCNDFGSGRMGIEMFFENTFKNPYFKFYVQCVAVRTENEVLCKINKQPVHKYHLTDNHTKITKNGKLAIGLGYYFKTPKERDSIDKCKSFCIEGFIALRKKTNVYGFACRVEKTDNGWEMIDGNTYRIYGNIDIESLYH